MSDSVTTTSAALKLLKSFAPYWPSDLGRGQSQAAFAFEVVASAPNGDSAAFFVRGAVKFTASGGVALIGVPEVAAFQDAGASTWDVSVVTDGSTIDLMVAGAVATTVSWVLTSGHVDSGDNGFARLSWSSQ